MPQDAVSSLNSQLPDCGGKSALEHARDFFTGPSNAVRS